MNTKFVFSLILGIAVLFYVVAGNVPKVINTANHAVLFTQNPGGFDKFILGAMDEENGDYQYQYRFADSLELNISHAYTTSDWINYGGIYRFLPRGRTPHDSLLTPVSRYRAEVTGYLTDIYNNHNHRRSITHRPKIQWLCYGQSSVYQCEIVPDADDQWFYAFNDHGTGTDIPDSGGTVRFCNAPGQGPNWDNPGYVCKRLKANTEQSNANNNFDGDSLCYWYIKPRIRINRDFANNPNNWDTLVCRVDVYNQNGNDNSIDPVDKNRIKSIDIRVRNFKINDTNQYNGSYREEFYFGSPWNDTSSQVRLGNWGNKFWFYARGNGQDIGNSADIRVYWYGNCDMWIDYVKVENDIADGLMNPNSPNFNTFNQWIKQEVEQIAFANGAGSEPVIQKFYIEYTEFNNLPCVRYVNDKLKYYSQQISGGRYTVDMMTDFFASIFAHLAWHEHFDRVSTPGWIYRNYIQRAGLTQFFAESYPLFLYRNKVIL